MSPDSQRIAIAEACGWTKCRLAIKGAGAPERGKSPYGVPPRRGYEVSLPNYTQDLNAMHEVEDGLPAGKWTRYCQYLAEFGQGSVRFVSVHSNAAQRAEAFLRTIGKWEDAT